MNEKSAKPDFSRARVINFEEVIKQRRAQKKTRSKALKPRSHRVRETETFARILHDRALELYNHRIGGAAWITLIELDRMILAQRGKNPVLFWSPRLRGAGLVAHGRAKALGQLEAAGAVKVESRGRGLSPWVTHLWHPLRD
jgi:hypothetical protein